MAQKQHSNGTLFLNTAPKAYDEGKAASSTNRDGDSSCLPAEN
jgi:hypothetical protein